MIKGALSLIVIVAFVAGLLVALTKPIDSKPRPKNQNSDPPNGIVSKSFGL
jgi:hypothetical protein